MGLAVTIAIIAFIFIAFAAAADHKRKQEEFHRAVEILPGFNATQEVMGADGKTGLAVDEQHRTVCLIYREPTGSFLRNVLDYKDLFSSELVEDGVEVRKTSRASQLGGALVGGALLGGVGVIVGGLSGKTKAMSKVTRLDLKIVVNDSAKPLHVINFLHFPSGADRSGFLFKAANERAQHWAGVLEVLIRQADSEGRLILEAAARQQLMANTLEALPPAPAVLSVADELRKLGELKVAGVLTEAEFEGQKRKLLNG
jgi:hypothetical protein